MTRNQSDRGGKIVRSASDPEKFDLIGMSITDIYELAMEIAAVVVEHHQAKAAKLGSQPAGAEASAHPDGPSGG